ncbi:MAG: leucyl aminopeptidase [Holosporaceae bacterium]|jgi:leucyl aminopeptidase|nr:leucyl aminopeptidase [Holosporaceae bacterium]
MAIHVSMVNKLYSLCISVFGVYSDGTLSPSAAFWDKELKGALKSNLERLRHPFTELFETFHLTTGYKYYNDVLLICLGEPDKKYDNLELERLGAAIYEATAGLDTDVMVGIDSDDLHLVCDCAPPYIGFGALLKSWKFSKYKTKKDKKNILERLCVVTKNHEKSGEYFEELKKIADGIFLTRQVVSEPANVIYPKSLAKIALDELSPLGVEVEILGADEMKKLGMNSLLAVAQGSDNEPQLAILRWNGGHESQNPIAFVGKGVTFDSGGISLKPGENMHEMRYDMAGSGTVLGLMKAVALNKLPVNIVGVMAMVENMPSGSAQRPGDVVKSMSGQTIEVMNTDAEGRMVLADALWYTQDRFNPKIIIDLATLTGAIVVALGHEFAGLFSNCDELAKQIYQSSIRTGEKVWRMPMSENFDKGINSDVADMQNIAKSNVRGGSITAAQFLKRFINGKRWAHIDIAGVETCNNDLFICSNGATGFGVYLLYDFLRENYAGRAN